VKVGIITIATGKYDTFVKGLVDSCEQNFLPGVDKKYIIFSDSKQIEENDKVQVIHQEKLGWPYDTMMRFHMFDSQRKELSKFDYLFFMNANLKIVDEVSNNILNTEGTCGIIATIHPGIYIGLTTPGSSSFRNKMRYPVERRKESGFYIPFGKESFYFQGCFNGGESKKFLSMSRSLKRLMDKDLENNIIPIWHDESALNWYLNKKKPKMLNPTFAYPDCGVNIGNPAFDIYAKIIQDFGSPKIIQIDKSAHGGHGFLRS
jgi:hypothetical protein